MLPDDASIEDSVLVWDAWRASFDLTCRVYTNASCRCVGWSSSGFRSVTGSSASNDCNSLDDSGDPVLATAFAVPKLGTPKLICLDNFIGPEMRLPIGVAELLTLSLRGVTGIGEVGVFLKLQSR